MTKVPPAPEVEVSVLMVTYGSGAVALEAIRRLAAHPPPSYELIVVDNASPDDTWELLTQALGDQRPPVRLVANERNVGFATAMNQAAGLAAAPLLLLLNPDAFVTPGWYEPLVRARRTPGVGAVVPMLRRADGRIMGGAGVVYRDGATVEVDVTAGRAPGQEFCPVEYGSGACLLVDTQSFWAAGGLDSGYAPVYFEDADFSFALRRAGRQVVAAYDSVVEHRHDLSGGSVTMTAEAIANRQRFVTAWNRELRTRPAGPAPEAGPVDDQSRRGATTRRSSVNRS